jgi:hypothetical protein
MQFVAFGMVGGRCVRLVFARMWIQGCFHGLQVVERQPPPSWSDVWLIGTSSQVDKFSLFEIYLKFSIVHIPKDNLFEVNCHSTKYRLICSVSHLGKIC